MIEYALLCQTIADWRAGRRPVLPQSSSPTFQAMSAGGTAPIVLGTPAEDDDAEMLDAGDADIDDGVDAVSDEADVPIDDGYGEPQSDAPPPDYDSTMVYGSGGAMPGQWPAEGAPDDGEPEPPR